jgi:hypothetical protein
VSNPPPTKAGGVPFEWLYDGLPEDGIQEYASLRADLAATPEDAAAKMQELYERDAGRLEDYGAGAHFVATKKEWRRGEYTVFDDDCEEIATFHGLSAEHHAQANDELDGLFYVGCAANDAGACEWWRCDLVLERPE